MARGNQLQKNKGQNARKSVADNSKQSTSSSPAVNSKSKASVPVKQAHSRQSIMSCCGCGTVITDDLKALQCDRCQSSESWKCADCLNISPSMYDHLVSDPGCSLRWFCLKCDKSVMEMESDEEKVPKVPNDSHNSNRIENLITVVEKLSNKLSKFQEQMNDKCDVHVVSKLESRVNVLEERLQKQELEQGYRIKDIDQRILQCESQISANASALEAHHKVSVTDPNSVTDQGVSDEELIKHMVIEEVKRKTTEEQDVETRKCNIIIYRAPEKKGRRSNDTKSE